MSSTSIWFSRRRGVSATHTHTQYIYLCRWIYIYVGKNCITSRCFGDTSRDERNPWQHPEGQTNKKETNKTKSQMFSCWQTRRTSVCIDRLLCYQLMPSSRTRDEELLIELSTNHYYGTYKTSGVCQPLDSTETELLRERERDWRRASFEWLRWVSARFDQLAINIGRYVSFRRGEWRAQIIMNFKTLTLTMWFIKLQTLCPLEKSNNNTKKKKIK